MKKLSFLNISFLSLWLIIFFYSLCGCQIKPQEDNLTLQEVRYKDLPSWDRDRVYLAYKPMCESCSRLLAKKEKYEVIDKSKTKSMNKVCKKLLKSKITNDRSFRDFLAKNFIPYQAKNNNKTAGLFTGYYIPHITASRVKTSKYKFPIYARPDDLVIVEDLGIFRPEKNFKNKRIAGKLKQKNLFPYFTREEIHKGALKEKKLEIAWTDSKVDLFFMQIQGSGIAVFQDGKKVLLSYDGTNGHDYISIGKVLLQQNKLKKNDVSLYSIKRWLHNNPKKVDKLLNLNKSYVFFKEQDHHEVSGSQKTQLSPLRSIAVDTAYIPLGVPMWLNVRSNNQSKGVQGLVMAQDTGGAIRGPIRADIFCGEGKRGERRAAALNNTGEYYLLLPIG